MFYSTNIYVSLSSDESSQLKKRKEKLTKTSELYTVKNTSADGVLNIHVVIVWDKMFVPFPVFHVFLCFYFLVLFETKQCRTVKQCKTVKQCIIGVFSHSVLMSTLKLCMTTTAIELSMFVLVLLTFTHF